MRSLAASALLAFATLGIVSRRSLSSGVPLNDIERLVSAPHDAFVPTLESSEVFHSTPPVVDLDGSWQDILQHSEALKGRPVVESGPSTGHVAPTAALYPHLREHTLEQRREILNDVKMKFYRASENGPSKVGPPQDPHSIEPFPATLNKGVFEAIMNRISRLGPTFYLFPFEIGPEQYLLQQAISSASDFHRLYGFATSNPKHVWYHVYHLKSLEGKEGVVELVGAFRGPHRDRNRVYRLLYLGDPTVRLIRVQSLTGATFKARVVTHPFHDAV